MQSLHHPFLRHRIRVNQQIAAGHQIEMRERRGFEHVVTDEQNHPAQFAPDTIFIALFGEEAAQPFGRHMRRVVKCVKPFARGGAGSLVNVGGENLNLRRINYAQRAFSDRLIASA